MNSFTQLYVGVLKIKFVLLPKLDSKVIEYPFTVFKKMRNLHSIKIVIAFTVAISTLLFIYEIPAHAETYTIEIGETFYYDSCWKNVGNTSQLERKYPGAGAWKQVAKSRVIASDECDPGYRLISYEWRPKSIGTHVLRERVSGRRGSRPSISKNIVLKVVETSYINASPSTSSSIPALTVLPPTSNSYSGAAPSFGSGNNLLGCFLKGKRLWGKVYFTNYSFDADFKVYFTNYSFDADIKVWNAPYSFSPNGCGQWYITNYAFDADFKVYVTNYSFDADLKIYTTKYQFDAGLP